jgi:hypothetical protein
MSGALNNVRLTTSASNNLSINWNEKRDARQKNQEITNTLTLGRSTVSLTGAETTLHSASVPPTSNAAPVMYLTVGSTTLAGALTVHGIPAGSNDQLLLMVNKTGQNLTMVDQSVTETIPGNRLDLLGGATTMFGDGAATFLYDAVTSRWILTQLRS